jgi:hypothetical protein
MRRTGRQDSIAGDSTALPIGKERVDWWLDRMRSIVAHLREACCVRRAHHMTALSVFADPGVPIWLRLIHRVGTQIARGSEDYIRGVEGHFEPGKQNFFTDLRCGQLREMQLALARELCLPVNDVRPP